MAAGPHAIPQPPQWSGSRDVFVQNGPQHSWPAEHSQRMQAPPEQVPDGHITPHRPQCVSFDVRSTQALPQSVSPRRQVSGGSSSSAQPGQHDARTKSAATGATAPITVVRSLPSADMVAAGGVARRTPGFVVGVCERSLDRSGGHRCRGRREPRLANATNGRARESLRAPPRPAPARQRNSHASQHRIRSSRDDQVRGPTEGDALGPLAEGTAAGGRGAGTQLRTAGIDWRYAKMAFRSSSL